MNPEDFDKIVILERIKDLETKLEKLISKVKWLESTVSAMEGQVWNR